jgi:hypothetical protein
MTQFGIIIACLVGILTLLTGILGFVWRMATAWQRTQDVIASIQSQLIGIIGDVAKGNTHDADILTRVMELERSR